MIHLNLLVKGIFGVLGFRDIIIFPLILNHHSFLLSYLFKYVHFVFINQFDANEFESLSIFVHFNLLSHAVLSNHQILCCLFSYFNIAL